MVYTANIDDGAYEMRTRYALSWFATLALLILFGFPVALAGFTSNVSQSCRQFWWLAWICRSVYSTWVVDYDLTRLLAPQIVQDIIQGVFPPVLLAVLFIILPYLLKGTSP
jgi:calcium permeable stress-gated cation channel